MSKHNTKEELEHDALVDFINKSLTFFNANKTTILSVGVTVIVVVAVLFGYNYHSSNQESKAQILLADAERFYSEGDFQTALTGDNATFTLGFTEIAESYAGTNAGNLATYYAAVSNYKLDKNEDALSYIQNYKHVEGILGVGSLFFEGALLELNGSFDQAAQIYEKAASWDVNDSTTPFNLFKAAQAYKKAGNLDKTTALASKIIQDYPNSPEFVESERLKGQLAVSK